MNKPTYIQIGSNVGGDDFFKMVKNLDGSSIIHLIEPNVSLHPQLSECYSDVKQHDIHIHNIGISNNSQQSTLHLYGDSGLSSLINRRSYNNKTGTLDIICESFNSFCGKNNITFINYLSIDCEGMDYEILNSIDLNSITIDTIDFEEWPYENDDNTGNYRTGEKFLNEEVFLKYKNYNIERVAVGGMASFKLIRNK